MQIKSYYYYLFVSLTIDEIMRYIVTITRLKLLFEVTIIKMQAVNRNKMQIKSVMVQTICVAFSLIKYDAIIDNTLPPSKLFNGSRLKTPNTRCVTPKML